jgi:hypothetical protein
MCYFRVADATERLNTTLARHGHIACAPVDPSLAFSFPALDLYRVLGARCPQLSIQVFVHGLCDLHHVCIILIDHCFLLTVKCKVPYPPYLRSQASVAIDAYYEIWRQVDARVAQALRRDSPDWRLRNACASCTYHLEDEKPDHPSMLSQMDANNSLKRIARVRNNRNSEGIVTTTVNLERRDERTLINDYFLTPEEVDKYKDEVKKRLPTSAVKVRPL